MKILFVEDEEAIQKLYRRVLEGQGLSLTITGTAWEALKIIDEQPFDLLISDLHLPDGDGMEIVAAFRRKAPPSPVLIITGSHKKDSEEQAENLGVNQLLYKPFDIEQFLRAVRGALDLK